jgi:hypothetical protein
LATRKSEKDRACGRRGKGGEEEAKYGVEEMRRWNISKVSLIQGSR